MNALASRGMIYADQLDEINRRVLNGEIDPQAARLVSDNFKWTAARLCLRCMETSSRLM